MEPNAKEVCVTRDCDGGGAREWADGQGFSTPLNWLEVKQDGDGERHGPR